MFWNRQRRQGAFEYKCGECGELHRGSPSFSYRRPPHVSDIPEPERETRVFLTSDLCVIDDEDFFIRALLEIPIIGVDEPFAWGVWVTHSQENFLRYQDTYDDDQTGDGAFGWLPVTMPGYDRADDGGLIENIPCDVYWRSEGLRPLVIPQESDHPLYKDVKDGISRKRAEQLALEAMGSSGLRAH